MIYIKEIDDVHSLPECLEVIKTSFASVAEEFNLTKENCPTHGTFMEIDRLTACKRNGALMFGLFKDEKAVGFVQLELKSGCAYELEKLAVIPRFRRSGYGRMLIDFCKDKVKELGGEKIIIGIIEENVKLRKWYEKNGFVHTGTKNFNHLPFTAGFMQFVIN